MAQPTRKGNAVVHVKKGVAFAVGALIFSAAQAQLAVQDCTGCSTAQIEAKAVNCGQGYTYISDFASQNLYKVCFTWDVNDEYRPPKREKAYEWAQPESSYLKTFQAYEGVWLNNGHHMAVDATAYIHVDLKPKVSVGGDNGYLNAYDTVRAPANSQQVLDWLDSTNFTTQNVSGAPLPSPTSPALESVLVNWMNSVKTSLLSFQMTINITVVFNDGSKRTYTIAPSGQWTTVPNTAQDSHGNPIPETSNAVAGNGSSVTYGFGGAGANYDQNNLGTLIDLYNIPVIYNPNTSNVVCTWNASTNTIHCILPK